MEQISTGQPPGQGVLTVIYALAFTLWTVPVVVALLRWRSVGARRAGGTMVLVALGLSATAFLWVAPVSIDRGGREVQCQYEPLAAAFVTGHVLSEGDLDCRSAARQRVAFGAFLCPLAIAGTDGLLRRRTGATRPAS